MTSARTAIAQTDLIDGRWRTPSIELPAAVADPNTGRIRQLQRVTTADDVERAIAAATALHLAGTWDESPVAERIRLLDAFADGLAGRLDEIAYEDAMATGNPLRVTTQMASYLPPRVRSSRDQLMQIGAAHPLDADRRDVRVLHRALGPAVVIAP